MQINGAFGRRHVTGDHLGQCGLPRPVSTDETNLVALVHAERDLVHQDARSNTDLKVLDLKHGVPASGVLPGAMLNGESEGPHHVATVFRDAFLAPGWHPNPIDTKTLYYPVEGIGHFFFDDVGKWAPR